ncbi:MAG: dihydroorotate dehydrogenase electron transfer subunit [Lachnospiraceae bacterium]|nr:dihydroorotate dehydrogenase electron transfer subunit [Lachnospiraceae bacterium]
MSKMEIVTIAKQECLAPGVYSMWIRTEDIARNARPGQFISVYSKDGSRLLPRPISICEIDGDYLRLVYRVVGKGTDEFKDYVEDDTLRVMGPLGNGYDVEAHEGVAVLFGGGIGVPPMLELAKRLPGKKQDKIVVLGYRDQNLFLKKEFDQVATVYIATDDGSVGIQGNVLDAFKEYGLSGDVFYACGPKPMLRGIKALSEQMQCPAYISLEERMACGVGACLACITKTTEVDEHSHVHNARICKDGPVFLASGVEL